MGCELATSARTSAERIRVRIPTVSPVGGRSSSGLRLHKNRPAVADLYAYLSALMFHWVNGYWVVTVAPEVLSYFIPGRWTECVDQFVSPDARRRAYIAVALFGVLAAGFQAWSDEHQAAQSSEQSHQQEEGKLKNQLAKLNGENQQLRDQLVADQSEIQRLQTDLAERKPESPKSEAKSSESAYSTMSNATLREIVISQAKAIWDVIHRTDQLLHSISITSSASTPSQRQARAVAVWAQLDAEKAAYKEKYMAKSIAMMLELRSREPDYVEEIGAQNLETLNRSYYQPLIERDLEVVARDLDSMAQRLPQ